MAIKKKTKKIFETLLSIIDVLYYSRFNTKINFVDIDKDECAILGNGPSLKNFLSAYIDFLENKEVICVNQFVKSECFEKIMPKYYLLLDPVYWIANIRPDLKQLVDEVYNLINNKTNWPMILFLPYQAKEKLYNSEVHLNPNIKIIFFNTTPIKGYRSVRHFFYKKKLGMPPAQNVLVAGIFMALNLGFKKVFLIGADHSWHEEVVVNSKNVVCLKNKQFNDASEASLLPWLKSDGTSWKMHEVLTALAKMFEGYHYLEEYSKFLNKKIYNASKKSYIDAFERYKIKDE